MNISSVLNDTQVAMTLETLDMPISTTIPAPLPTSLEGQELPALPPSRLYQQGMEDIWQRVHSLPIGPQKVVLSQLWDYGKMWVAPAAEDFPALVVHGFLIDELIEGQAVWKPYTPHLKDFRRFGIHFSNDYGFILQPHHIFQTNLDAYIVQRWDSH